MVLMFFTLTNSSNMETHLVICKDGHEFAEKASIAMLSLNWVRHPYIALER